MTPKLSDDQNLARVAFSSTRLKTTRSPTHPRLDPLKAILAKLEPPQPRAEPVPLRPGMVPGGSIVASRRRQRR